MNLYNTGATVELGDLIDSGFDLWNFDYPTPRPTIEYNGKTCSVDYDDARLRQKIVDAYRFRQIGQETPARFRHYLKTRMQAIMPYYVQLYEFDAKFRNIEDPLESYNLMETFQQETADNSSGETTGTASRNDSKTLSEDKERRFSDTPQGSITNLNSYMTEATVEDNGATETASGSENTTGTSKVNNAGTTSHTLTRRGNIGVQPLGGEVENIRSAFINIDQQIVDELADLFLLIY